jgi:hypothetical protein
LDTNSEREVLRARRRTTQAMCTRARDQGRHLGGRPPYGYRLVDAGPHPNPRNDTAHCYRLTGLLICGICGRRLEGHWVHDRAGYRCRHGHTSARPRDERVRSVYWAERRILHQLLYSLSYQGELPLFAGIDDLLNHLQTRTVVIICAVTALRLETAETGTPNHNHPSLG